MRRGSTVARLIGIIVAVLLIFSWSPAAGTGLPPSSGLAEREEYGSSIYSNGCTRLDRPDLEIADIAAKI